MKEKRRKRKKEKLSNTWKALLIFVVLLVTTVTISIYLQKPPLTTKYPAREYFVLSDAVALATPGDPENKTLKIKQLDFKITPIKGDAHHVVIIPSAGVEVQDYPYFEEIKGNETICLSEQGMEITFKYYYLSVKNEEGRYPVSIRLSCDETSNLPEDQKVTVYVTSWTAMP